MNRYESIEMKWIFAISLIINSFFTGLQSEFPAFFAVWAFARSTPHRSGARSAEVRACTVRLAPVIDLFPDNYEYFLSVLRPIFKFFFVILP